VSEEKVVDSGEILKTLVKQGAFKAAREYVDFLEKKETTPRITPPVEAPES